MPDKLVNYRKKRNFSRSPEPAGRTAENRESGRYVMHKHAASHDHFDLRLEWEGVLRSWAVPKGPSLKPGEKRLAVEVEDHPLDYGDFEGVIPKEEYGGGTVMVWDCGTWEPRQKPTPDRIDFCLNGEKLKGHWTLVRTHLRKSAATAKKNNWLLIKRSDQHKRGPALPPDDLSVKSGRTMEQIAGQPNAGEPATLPQNLTVQLATLTRKPPEGDQWIHELKFDGYRLIARLDKHSVTLLTRNGKDWTRRLPAIRSALEQLTVENAVIDGELVVPRADGSTSFRRLQQCLGSNKPIQANLAYQAFDLLFLNDHSLVDVPLLERKRVLKELLPKAEDGRVRYSDHIQGHGAGFFEEVCQLGLEGMVSKRIDAPYRNGRHSHWLKTKCMRQAEFVIGGYLPSDRRPGFGSLLLGAFQGEELLYTGRVGAGFTGRQLRNLQQQMSKLRTPDRPFSAKLPDARDACWVRPEIVVDVEYSERTSSGVLRHPVFRGVREDKAADEVQMMADDHDKQPDGRNIISNVPITHPERVLFPEANLTKLEIAQYYRDVADWMLPYLRRRPLSLLRCPGGLSGECFFQKHPDQHFAVQVPRVKVPEKRGGTSDYVYVDSVSDLVWLVQFGVLELHPWGCRLDDLERPDTLVFDLDPDPELPWKAIAEVAKELRARLDSLGLNSFLQATGGKGLHLVVPIKPGPGWDEAKALTKIISKAHARDEPKQLTTNMAKAKRKGRVFIDYLRNGRGSTSIARYSTRARGNAGIATPIRWEELNTRVSANRYTVDNIRRRLSALRSDPWEGYEEARCTITRAMLNRLKVGEST